MRSSYLLARIQHCTTRQQQQQQLSLLKHSSFIYHGYCSRGVSTARRDLAHHNTDRFQGPVTSSSSPMMQTIKNTIAENMGKAVSGAHKLAPEDSQFSLDQVPDLTGKVGVITGGTQGIGWGCTHTLLSHNIQKLFVISQSEHKANDVIDAVADDMGREKADRIVWLQCDLSDWEAVGKVADSIAQKTDRLDILINNAVRGIMTRQLAANGVDLHMAIGHFGHVVLTARLLPLLKQTSSQGDKVRIVTLASNLHTDAPPEVEFASLEEINKDYGPRLQYGRTKLAAILFAKYVARHVSASHPSILSNATHPGIVETAQTKEHIHEAYPIIGYAMSVGMAPFRKTQWEGCVSTMFAATATNRTGQYICPPAIVEKGNDKANDEALEERLMKTTWEILREKCKDGRFGQSDPFKES